MSAAAAASVNATAERFAARRGFPALTGSPTQIAWAEQVRMRLIKSLESAMRTATFPARVAQHQSKRDWMLEHTEAAWWISQRYQKPLTAQKQRFAQALAGYASLMR